MKAVSDVLLNIMFPLRMLLKLYSLCILMVDISWVLVNTAFAIIQTGYETFRPPPMKSVRLETAMVVGAGRGVGRSIAIQLAELGAIVICVDKNSANNDITIEIIKSKGGVATGYMCDVTKRHDVEETANVIQQEMGFVSMLFYCCGIPSTRSLMEDPEPDIHETLDLSLTSYFWFIDLYMPTMKNKNRGHFVALTSVAGLSRVGGDLPLSVAQFAVQGLAESLMEDLRIHKIDGVYVTLVHIYPFIVGNEHPEMKQRIPSFFGTISPDEAAKSILDNVRRNYTEVSVPKNLLFLGRLLKILPRKATALIRDLLDTGVDFV